MPTIPFPRLSKHAVIQTTLWVCMVGGCLFGMGGCSKQSEAYRQARDAAYKSAFDAANNKAYLEAYSPAFAAANQSAYEEKRKALVKAGEYRFRSGVLLAVVIIGGSLGFAIQYAVSSMLRQAGILKGDIDLFLAGR